MSSLLKSVGMLFTVLGLGSFIIRLFGRDSLLFHWMGGYRNIVMSVATVCGAGLFALAYRVDSEDDDEDEDETDDNEVNSDDE